MSISAEEVRNKILREDPEVRREYEALETEYATLKKIIRCRAAQNMSKAQLAHKAGVSRKVVEDVEKDIGGVPLRLLCKIVNALGMELRVQLQPRRY